MKPYTKADLEQIVCTQLENLNAMDDLIRILKKQNELLEEANERFRDEVADVKVRYYRTGKMVRPKA